MLCIIIIYCQCLFVATANQRLLTSFFYVQHKQYRCHVNDIDWEYNRSKCSAWRGMCKTPSKVKYSLDVVHHTQYLILTERRVLIDASKLPW